MGSGSSEGGGSGNPRGARAVWDHSFAARRRAGEDELPFKLGVGGRIGSGQQWMSWVTLEDVVEILRFALESGTVQGAINVVAPGAVRNAEFTRELARALHRPALFPAPAFALRLVLGEMADALLLSSQRVVPQKLQQLGYRFLHADLAVALAAVLSGT